MSFFKNLKKAFGFGPSEPSEDDSLLSDEGNAPDGGAPAPQPAATSAPEAAPEPPQLDPGAVKAIFTSVIGVFNDTLPAFLKDSVDPKAQEEYIYNALDRATKDYLTRLIDDARVFAEKEFRHSNNETLAELARLRQEKTSLEQQRSSIKEQQLSSDRRRRALVDRVTDLEGQIATLEAEREQFELENKSLLNKIKLSEIQPGVVEELQAEVERLRAQVKAGGAAPAGEDFTLKLKEKEARIEELTQALAARDEAHRTANEMFNSMQHELVEERRKGSEAIEELRLRNSELEAATAEKDAQIEEASRLLKGMEQITAQMQQVESAINKRDEKIKGLQTKNRELRQKLEKAEKRLQSGRLMPSLPFGDDEEAATSADPEESYGSDMIATSPIRPEDIGDDDFHSVDWLTSTPPKGTVIPSGLTDEEFGYQEPPRKPKPKDHDSQLSLF